MVTKQLEIPAKNVLWNGFTPAPEQELAIEFCATKRVFVLTGGPGVGKTATVAALIKLLEHNHQTFALVAPTGKAAKRMGEATGHKASTIHRATGYGMKPKTIAADVVICDETSMVDVLLFQALLNALMEGARLVLVGDVDQLPSIGCGNVLADIIESGSVPVVRLTRIFRTAEDSRIPYAARDIINGRVPETVEGSDFTFVEVPNYEDTVKDEKEAREMQLKAAQQIITRAITKLIPDRKAIATKNSRTICAQKNHEIGVEALNRLLQNEINPLNGRDELFIGEGYAARAGDIVIHKKNNYDLDTFNGEIGFVTRLTTKKDGLEIVEENVVTSAKTKAKKAAESVIDDVGEVSVSKEKSDPIFMVVDFGDKKVGYTKDEAKETQLAYALTGHAMQGSQSEAVVIPVMSAHYWMLTRRWLYTAVTRAEKLCLLVGTKQALARAVRNTRDDNRRTSLKERLAKNGPTNDGPDGGEEAPVEIEHVEAEVEVMMIEESNASNEVDVTKDFNAEVKHVGQVKAAMMNGTVHVDRALPAKGYFTIVLSDETHMTFRIETETSGTFTGKTIVSKLVGPANTSDYMGVAFVDAKRLTVWKSHRNDARLCEALEILVKDPKAAGKAFAMESGRCWHCKKLLTTEASIKAGLGPECAKRFGA